MTRPIAMIVIGAALLGACDDSASNDQRLYDSLAARIPQGDVQTVNECECFFADYGYASYSACLAGELTGAIPPNVAACLRDAVAGYGEFADYTECTLRANVQLSTCLSNAECTDPAFDSCYAAEDAAVQACAPYSPCHDLTGSALTQCQTDGSLLLSETSACFQ